MNWQKHIGVSIVWNIIKVIEEKAKEGVFLHFKFP